MNRCTMCDIPLYHPENIWHLTSWVTICSPKCKKDFYGMNFFKRFLRWL